MSRKFINVGGQAVIEGIAMKGPYKTCLAVRKKDGTIFKEITETQNRPFAKIPILRGAAALVKSLINGYKYIDKSAEISGFYDEEDDAATDNKSERTEEKKSSEKNSSDGWITVVASVLAVAIAILLFTVLPTWIVALLSKLFHITKGRTLLEGLFKILIFVGYLFLVTRMKSVHRVFEYHGAEHKTINCIEAGEELTVDNVLKNSRFHPRCGTSYMFLIVFISVLFYSLVPWTSVFSRTVLKILLIPVIAGASYEVLQYSGKHDNGLTRILSAPGLAIQRLTTFEPSADQAELAIEAIKEVLPEEDQH